MATLASVRSVQVTSDAGTQRSMDCEGAYQGAKVVNVVVGPSADDRKLPTVVDAVTVAAPDHVESDLVTNAKETMKDLKTENMSLHCRLVAERTAHALELIDNIRLQRDMEKHVQGKKEAVRLLTAKRSKQRYSSVIEQLKKNVPIIHIEEAEVFDVLVTLLEHAKKVVRELE